MQETKQFNEKRAEIYWWLSSLFAAELTDKELDAYHSADIRAFIQGLASNDKLSTSASALIDCLNKLQDREDAQLELAADFCDLFLTSDKGGALPYASIYVGKSGLLNDVPAQEMAALMNEKGIGMQEGFNEPADHLAVELDFLGNLIIQSNQIEDEDAFEQALAEQKEFINNKLLNWLPKFVKACKDNDEYGFYAAVSTLLIDFLALDSQYLSGE
ncbi:molecular chaperone TorD [Vibrio sp. SCSIO 43136]|uniref:molecular chaperone TorD n=1 Tax=Vibrio sp. SCSIO 43136 TaxID=2819101 RepID=UPI0020756858|nr:molecular chaperone TorD [Vibrio sp. SCSIO 43136]USD66266.1 molecular chaperone TorD [Vibrio sp. SCSIO 43136]